MVQLFGPEHLILLGVYFALAAALGFFVWRKRDQQDFIRKMLVVIAILHIVVICINRVSICIRRDTFNDLLPDTFCGFLSIISPIIILTDKKQKRLLHGLLFPMFMGGFLALIYPSYLSQASSIFYIPTISGLTHHEFLLIEAVVILASGYLVPTVKRWYAVLMILGIYMVYGGILMLAGIYPAIEFINKPILDAKILEPYIILPLAFAVQCLILLGIELYRKVRHRPRRA